ncbi:MAG: FecR domain-containing protein [Archangium sp.]|nr:FecR domain-containing protein [Archangium sp.]
MTRHDMQLWAYANKELELGEHRFVEAHLEVCPECSDELASIRLAREALSLAREAGPVVTWSKVDERVGSLVEKRLARQARGPWMRRLVFGGGGLLAVAAAVAVVMMWPRPEPLPIPLDEPSVPTSSWARVDRAEGLSRVGGEKGAVVDGTELHGGDVIRTSLAGKAFVHLPDLSHLRVGAASQLALTRSEADDVALTLERGTLAVRASHRVRKGFVVHTGGVLVTVIGTVFGVTNDSDVVEVSVSEGRVKIELPNGEVSFIEPGQRVRFDTKTQKVKQLKLAPAMEKQLAEVVAADEAVTAVEGKAIGPAVGGSPSAPPMITAQGTPRSLPRLSAEEARSRQVQAPVTTLKPEELNAMPAPAAVAAPPAQNTVVIPAPDDVWPTIGGGEVIRGVPQRREGAPAPTAAPAPVAAAPVLVPAPPLASQPNEWAEVPKPDETEWDAMPARAAAPAPAASARLSEDDASAAPAPAPVVTVTEKKGVAKDLEAQFLAKADDSVAKGAQCDRFLLGLEEIAQDSQKSVRSEQARVLRARCFDVQMRPRQAMGEYRKYLDEYPRGRFAHEAHEALGE